MTQSEQRNLDSKLQSIKQNCTPEQWKDPAYLKKKVEELESSDSALAYRLMQRVRLLDSSEVNISELNKLQKKAFAEHPNLVKTTSSERIDSYSHKIQNARLKSYFHKMKGHALTRRLLTPFGLVVFLPVFAFIIYQLMIASPRYESRAQIILKEPDGMSTLDPSLALMSGFGMPQLNTDVELVKSYIHSNDMFLYIEKELNYVEHFSDSRFDLFSRLSSSASTEEQLEYFQKHTEVIIDEKSLVLSVSSQAFESDFAKLLSEKVVSRAEWFINEVGHNLARAQLSFVEAEHQIAQQRLKKAKSELLSFQRRYNLLDPEAESLAFQQIAYGLEGEIAAKRTELNTLRKSMSENAPLVIQLREELNSLLTRLEIERNRLTSGSNNTSGDAEKELGVGEILAKFSDFKIDMELALQAYTASQVSLEKSRIEAYRQLKYLVIVEKPTKPDSARYPNKLYNISLFLTVMLMLFGIGRIIFATANELRQ